MEVIQPNNEPTTSGNPTIIVNQPVPKSNGMGTAGFVLALLALFLGWVPVVGWILWVLGLIFSCVGVFRTPKGLAIAGLIICLPACSPPLRYRQSDRVFVYREAFPVKQTVGKKIRKEDRRGKVCVNKGHRFIFDDMKKLDGVSHPAFLFVQVGVRNFDTPNVYSRLRSSSPASS